MNRNKKGFTLAEAMITLVIIGIISAIVIPSVINRFEIRTRETRANKARYDIAMATGLVASQHIRWRDLSTVAAIQAAFNNTGLPDNAEIHYYYSNNLNNGRLVIGADVDGDNAADIIFYATKTGALEEDTGNNPACTIDAYKERNTAALAGCSNKATVLAQ